MLEPELSQALAPGAAVRTERSYCRVCTAQCGILIDIEGEEVVRVRGDRDHPLTHGYTCPKGRALAQMHHHPQRIERPMLRRDGALAPASWDAVLGDLAGKLRAIIDEHGPSSVGIFYGSGVGMDASGYRMTEALQAAIGTPAKFSPLTIDGTAKTLVSTLVGGFPGFSVRPDYDAVNLVLFIGINPMISHGHTVAMPNPAPTIKAAAARGAVWVIDPRESDTVGFASRHIAPWPGTDYAILAYLMREILRAGAEAPGVRTVDAEALEAAVEPFDAAHAAAISGVAPEELAELLAAVRKAGRLAVETGTGVTMSVGANLTQWLAWVLMILTDSMNRTGGVWFHPGYLMPMDMAPLPVIDQPFGPGPASRPELPSFVGDWPCAALPDAIGTGEIRAFLNMGGNIIRSFPDAGALTAALEKLEVFATLEIIDNETTALSTHVMPTKDQLERPDFVLWDFLSPRVNAQYSPAALPRPVGDRRSAWWIIGELMQRIGFERPAHLPADDRASGADDAVLSTLLPYARCGFGDLTENRYVETPTPELPARWVDDHVERIGGWRLAPPALVQQLAEVSAHHLAAPREAGSLLLIPRRQRRHVNAQFLFLGDRCEVILNPADAAAAGIEDGQGLVVRSERGEIEGVAKVDAKIRQGVVSVPHGHEDANVNVLTSIRQVDSLTGMARYSGVAVTVHPL